MKVFNEPVYVTRPYLPPIEEFKRGCEEIWANQWLTNNGPVLLRFQRELAEALSIPEKRLSLLANGTLALEIVYQALGINIPGAEVITTPFTFVATSHALRRIGATPVFADIDPKTLCMTPETAEPLITKKTRAIVPVHVYGHPCDVDGFSRLAAKYDLRLVYDAAHAFGVKLDGQTIGTYGDAAMFSLHATKLFHSIEGGLLAFRNPELKKRIEQLKNFAISSETTCEDVGTNAKMNEISALMGECCLRAFPELIAWRKKIHETYEEAFAGDKRVTFLSRPTRMYGHSIVHNYAYCPILFKDFSTREHVYEKLKEANIFTRRYFYPLLTDFAPYRATPGHTPVAREMADRILTLPTYQGLTLDDARTIARNIQEIL